MGVKHKKLKEWVSAGLMSAEQAESIHAYEEARKSGRFGRGLIGLSLFAILIGVLSIIAANWNEISGNVKIGIHVLLNLGIGFIALQAHKKGNDLWREGAALAFMGLTFTLIVLVGQVFQMTGTPADAALFWLLITLPFFLLLGRGHMTAVPWMLAFLATVWMVLLENVESLPQEQQSLLVLGIGAFLPLALMADGAIESLKTLRPALCDVALRAGLFLSALGASVSLAFWPADDLYRYGNTVLNQTNGLIVLGLGMAAIAAHAFVYGFYKNDPAMKGGALLALAGLAGMIVPTIVPLGNAEILPALAFIGYWVFVGWLAQGMHKMRLVSLAITIIAVRIFIIYVELFGSLMTTGFGLISGGVVMLALIYGARRLNKRITKGEVAA